MKHTYRDDDVIPQGLGRVAACRGPTGVPLNYMGLFLLQI
jgi:hypothetical protein